MKITAKAILFVLISSAVAFAEAPRQVGAWSVYPAAGNQVVLLQTKSEEQFEDAQGHPLQAKLDVICKKGRVSGIAVETDMAIDRNTQSFSGAIPTTRIAFALDGGSNESENWAVMDGGHTVIPYSEVFQGKLTRHWVQLLSGTQKIVLQLSGRAGQSLLQPTFKTGELSQALSSAGCTD